MKVKVAQSYPTHCNPINCSPPGSSVHRILPARTLECVAVPFSRGFSQLRDQSQVSCIAGRFFTIRATREYVCMYLSVHHLFIYLSAHQSIIFLSLYRSLDLPIHLSSLWVWVSSLRSLTTFPAFPCTPLASASLNFMTGSPPAISQEESHSPLKYMPSEFSAQGHDAPKTTKGRMLHNQAMDLKPGRNLLQKFFARIPL